MNFEFSEEQQMLRDNARRFLTETCTFEYLRAHLDRGTGIDHALWKQIARLGWTGVAVPEDVGGLGLGGMELCVLAEELGRVLAPVPFRATACVAVELLKHVDEQQALELLGGIAAGDAIVAVGGLEQSAPLPLTRFANGAVSGHIKAVPWAMEAGHMIATTTAPEGELAIVLIDLAEMGVTRNARPGIDLLQPLGDIAFDNAPTFLLASGPSAEKLLDTVRDQAAVIAAFEQVGGADSALALTVGYVKERYAFGRQIGGYQAVKHKLADIAVKIELARSNAWFGAWAFVDGPSELPLAAAAARLSATQAFDLAAQECIHLHGGIGYTWEANCHFFYTRARYLSAVLGNSAQWGERLLHAARISA
ncbi:acyl-CoA/acyl-ACP dehydrogenase [Burkholderia sp. R-69980]|nr:acyl-CoA/acyl-ACP dehydrogenase [Burkholderia sp. R-69980]